MSKQVNLNILYDGSALKNHEMEANDLAPALLAFSELIETSNQILNPSNSKISVKIKGSFQSGSFDIALVLSQSIDGLLGFLTSNTVEAPLNLLAILGFCTGTNSVIDLLKKLKGREPTKIIKKGENVEIIVDQQETYTTSIKVFALFSNVKIRQKLEQVIAPLKKEGIDLFKSHINNQEIQKIDKHEVVYFEVPQEKEILLEDNEFETNLQLVSVSFQETNKWKFSDGNSAFFASIQDEEFIKSVQSGKSNFAKDDILKVRLRRKQFEKDQKIQTVYEIIKVTDHRRPNTQLSMFIQEDL